MMAVVTRGNGDYDQLDYCEVPVPRPESNEIVLRVLAAGVNNTEINTRLGWYSASVTGSTKDASDGTKQKREDGGWNERTPFPFIQGTDCCGCVAAIGRGVDRSLLGKRALVRACVRPDGFNSANNIWMGSDFDGAFAQFVKVPASEVFAVECDWTDAELATIPCAYGTAENMIHRANVSSGQTVLVTGASGGVGSAAVQLAKRRGATIIAIAGTAKHEKIRALGASEILNRNDDPKCLLGKESIDVVVDNVAGHGFPAMLDVLKRGGVYVSSGAIAGPLVELDMRTFYLKDLTLVGCTGWDEPVFPNLISYIERGEIEPILEKTFPLEKIALAQKEFLEKKHVGKIVLIPPS